MYFVVSIGRNPGSDARARRRLLELASTGSAETGVEEADGAQSIEPSARPVATGERRLRHLASRSRALSCSRRFLTIWASISSRPSESVMAPMGVCGSLDQNMPRSSLGS
jgi:hypothetical protein